MIGKGNVVEVGIGIVGIEGTPAATPALQPLHPLIARAEIARVVTRRNACLLRPVHRHRHHAGVVQVGIMVVAVLEGPASRPHIGLFLCPVALHIENLQRRQPGKSARHGGIGPRRPGFHQRVGDQGGVPHRRDARLAIGFVRFDDEQILHRPARNDIVGMILGITQQIIHHHAVGHGGVDGAQPILAIQPFGGPGAAFLDGAGAGNAFGQKAAPASGSNPCAEKDRPIPALVRRAGWRQPERRRRRVRAHGCRADCAPGRFSAPSTSSGTITVRAQ